MPPRQRPAESKRPTEAKHGHPAPGCSPQELASWTAAGFIPVHEIENLSAGTKIVALAHDRVLRSGVVTDIAVPLGVVWVLDEQSNTRKLIERERFTLLSFPPEITTMRSVRKKA